MQFHSRAASAFGIVAMLAAVSFAGGAAARTCTTAAACPLGFRCLSTGESADGGTVSSCISLSCQSNADCGSGTVCDMDMGSECVDEADGGQSCSPFNACVPQWQAPCTIDSDCGDGFHCIANGMVCDCSGKLALLDAGGVVTPCDQLPSPPHPPPMVPSICDAGSSCVCKTTRSCQEIPMAPCSQSTDCLPGWTCMCPPLAGTEIPADANVDEGGCSAKVCEPPNWDLSNAPSNGTSIPPGASYGGSSGASDASSAALGQMTNDASSGADLEAGGADATLAASGLSGTRETTPSGGGCAIALRSAHKAHGGSGLWLSVGWGAVALPIMRRRASRRAEQPQRNQNDDPPREGTV
jgi:hypothetical protein